MSAAALVASVPVFAPAGRSERGRVSAATVRPGHALPDKVVVDFGWRSAQARLDLEIAVRRWEEDGGPDRGRLRAFCAERDFMQRCTQGVAGWAAPGPAADAVWSALSFDVDGVSRSFTVLTTAYSWVAATVVDGGWLLRLFAPAVPEGFTGVRRVVDAADLEPVRGQG